MSTEHRGGRAAGPPSRFPRLDRLTGASGCAAGVLLAGLLLACWGRSPLPLLAALAAAPSAVRWWRRRGERQAAGRRRDEVIAFCASLAGEVRAGRQPAQALTAVGAPELGPPGARLLAAARYGGDIPAALRSAARRPGAEGLLAVAACWQVAVDGGASLAAGLERVASALRAERDQQEDVRAQLAGPATTALVLAALPLTGLLLGSAMGVRPLEVLLHSAAGLGCLVTGVLLEWAGLAWVAAIVRSAERPGTGREEARAA
ncbi:type II secretion system F family protein [Streptomyces sodiiphilus]|uniref:Type II secretion system F family protein n=1 Tax=Streptomyces sodiiphilus TaxID=226217 RepID=A0ABN2PSN2_9ACTN